MTRGPCFFLPKGEGGISMALGWGGQYTNYWAPLMRKRHTMPHPAQPQHTNHWAPRPRKRHQQEHRPQRLIESNNPTQYAKGRTGDCPGPRKETTTRRNVTHGWGGHRHKLLFKSLKNFFDVRTASISRTFSALEGVLAVLDPNLATFSFLVFFTSHLGIRYGTRIKL